MAHHFPDPNLVPDAVVKQLNAELTSSRESLRLGATGRYPEGKLGKHDEGEIAFAVAADPVNRKVLIDFGKPVAFLGMNKTQAIELGQMLIAKAEQIKD